MRRLILENIYSSERQENRWLSGHGYREKNINKILDIWKNSCIFEVVKRTKDMEKKMPKEYNPWIEGIASFINGAFDGMGIEVEINTSLSFISVKIDEENYTFQGDDADEIVKEICWRCSELHPTETFEDNIIHYFNERF